MKKTFFFSDLPVKDSEVYTEYLLDMDSKWNASMNLFKDDLNALPELFTKMATKFVANLRFSCPSAFFDSLYVRKYTSAPDCTLKLYLILIL